MQRLARREMTAPRPDRRRARTRGALVEAGVRLLSLRPIEAVSVDEITESADIAKGSFYNHFKDKESLAREVAREVREEVEARVAQANRDIADPAVRVARALLVFALYAQERPERARALSRLHAGATLPGAPSNRGVRADLVSGLACGRFSGFALETGVMSIIATVQITLARLLDPAAPRLREKALADIAAFLLRGLGLSGAAARNAAAQAASLLHDQSFGRKLT